MFNKIANEQLVEKIVHNLGVSPKYADDLIQEIYLILLEYNREKIIELYNNKQLNFFITRIVKNQWMSNTSPFYKKYRKIHEIIDANVESNAEIDNIDEDGDNEDNE